MRGLKSGRERGEVADVARENVRSPRDKLVDEVEGVGGKVARGSQVEEGRVELS